MSTPLAWKNLTHDRRRLVIATMGVAFAAILIFMQLGFLYALLESTVQILRRLNGELIMIRATRYALPTNDRFDISRLQQAAGVAGIADVYPMYMETVAGVLRPANSRGYPIRVLAFHELDPAFDGQPLATIDSELSQPQTALADLASRPKFQIPTRESQLSAYSADLNGMNLDLVGHFQLGVDFATNGTLLMTAANFASYFPQRASGDDPLRLVDLGILQVEPDADPMQVRSRLAEVLPADVQVFTRQELINREKVFWRTSAPVGFIFLVGVYMGFIVGVIICYQIIYTDIANHLREFATLKAMGYERWYFFTLVVWQSFYLCVLGFIPGAIISYGCYRLLARYTGLTMQMTLPLVSLVFVVTLLMCIVSGVLALRKLLKMDPAELF